MAAIARDLIEMGELVFDQREAALRGLHQIGTAGNRGLIAVDTDDLTLGGGKDGAAIAAGAEGAVDIDAFMTDVQEIGSGPTQHRDVPVRTASDCRQGIATGRHSRAPGKTSGNQTSIGKPAPRAVDAARLGIKPGSWFAAVLNWGPARNPE